MFWNELWNSYKIGVVRSVGFVRCSRISRNLSEIWRIYWKIFLVSGKIEEDGK